MAGTPARGAGVTGGCSGMLASTVFFGQHVFRKLGFSDVLSAPYKTFQFNGQAVFASIESAEATILMERSI